MDKSKKNSIKVKKNYEKSLIRYTEYISRMESNNNTFKIIVNRKFPRETNEKRQLEHFEKVNIDESTTFVFYKAMNFSRITHYLLFHTQVTQ